MRSSKNRSRSKGNRNRSVGNIVNRVFDSSGPEGKVRGTPQQIIDKYNQLARDAQLSNDRVAAENFQQHAEHYTRLLSEAQRELDARREQQEAQNAQRRERQQDGRDQHGQREQGASDQPSGEGSSENAFDDVIDNSGGGKSTGIVETAEDAPKPRRGRGRRKAAGDGAPADAPPSDAATGGQGEGGGTPESSSEAAE